MNQRTYRAFGYNPLSEALNFWQQLPAKELIAQIDFQAESSLMPISGEEIAIDIFFTWIDAKHNTLRISGIAYGTSHLQIQRVEETIIAHLQER